MRAVHDRPAVVGISAAPARMAAVETRLLHPVRQFLRVLLPVIGFTASHLKHTRPVKPITAPSFLTGLIGHLIRPLVIRPRLTESATARLDARLSPNLNPRVSSPVFIGMNSQAHILQNFVQTPHSRRGGGLR
jgi:hypothetical protein